MSVVESLAAWGILRPAAVVALADATGLPLAAAAALLEQESAGGHNVWGSDDVPTGGAYLKGGPVDEPSYRAYRAALAAGRAGQQGVGPCQLTSVTFQDRADAVGGSWEPVPNMRAGFALLAGYALQWGLPDAFRAYNGGPGNRLPGGNANADRYASGAMESYQRWATRLGPASTTTGDDMPLTQADADLVVRTLLTTPLQDLYPDVPTRTMTLGDTLAWAAAHAARAETQVARLRDEWSKAGAFAPALHAALLDALVELGPLTLTPAKETP